MKPTTIADVARQAGVSKATVSRVINDSALVATTTRDKVLQTIAELDFRASFSARSLALGRANAIGIISSEPLDELFSDPTFGVILRGISERISALNLVSVLLQAATASESEKVIKVLDRGIVDGLVHISPYQDSGLFERLSNIKVPVAICGRIPAKLSSIYFSSVFSDDIIGAELATKHALSVGVKVPAIILGPPENSASSDRHQGYRVGLGSAYRPDLVVSGGWGESTGKRATKILLDAEKKIDCFLCASDRIARGVLEELSSQHINVPNQIRVIGFDNHRFAAELTPSLTTISQPFQEQGARAVDLVVEQLNNKAPRVEILANQLIVRESA